MAAERPQALVCIGCGSHRVSALHSTSPADAGTLTCRACGLYFDIDDLLDDRPRRPRSRRPESDDT